MTILDRHFDMRYPGSDALPLRLARFRLESFRKTLLEAQTTTFYQSDPWPKAITKALAHINGKGDDKLRLSAALEELPFTNPLDLEKPELFLAVSQSEIAGIISTSGSSRFIKRIFSTEADLENVADFFQWGMGYLVDKEDRVALLMSGERPGSVGDLLARAMNKRKTEIFIPGHPPLGPGEDDFIHRLIDFAPTCLVGVPTQVLALARHPLGVQLRNFVKTILLSGDVVPATLKKALEDIWEARVFQHYGLTEFGLGGAVECEFRLGPHLREADLAVEIIGPDHEIVISSLTRQAMPLLRYRTGDEGCLLEEPCPCGSIMRRLQTMGRLTDRLPFSGTRLMEIENIIWAQPEIKTFKTFLTDENKITFEITTIPNRPLNPDLESILTNLLVNMEVKVVCNLNPPWQTKKTTGQNGKLVLERNSVPD